MKICQILFRDFEFQPSVSFPCPIQSAKQQEQLPFSVRAVIFSPRQFERLARQLAGVGSGVVFTAGKGSGVAFNSGVEAGRISGGDFNSGVGEV